VLGGVGVLVVAAIAAFLLLRDGEGGERPDGAGAERPAVPFEGSWQATDALDNSTIRASISRPDDGRFRVVLTDDRVSFVCKGESVRLTGMGTVQGSTLTVNLAGPCDPSGTTFSVTMTFTHHPSSDTLTDDVNPDTVWSRASTVP
jgi:hypothetical protein